MNATVNVDELLGRGDTLFEARRFQEAVETSDAVLSAEPSNLAALWLKARALNALGKTEAAISSYDRAAAASPGNPNLLAHKAHVLDWLGRSDAAIETVRRAIALDRDNATWHAQHVALLRRAGRLEEALTACDDLLKGATAETRGRWLVEKSEVLRDLKRFDAAFLTLSQADAAFSASEWTRWADNLRYEGNNTEALRYYEKAIALDPQLANAWRGKGLSLSADQRFDAALQAFTTGAAADPKSGTCSVDKGNVYFDLRQFQNAVDCYNEALAIEPGNQYALVNLGLVYQNLGDYTKAIDYYKRALETDPNFLDAVLSLASSYDAAGQASDALQTYDRALTLSPDSFRALNDKGYLLLRQGEREQAIQYFERAMLSPDRHGERHPWMNKARALREMRRYDEAEACLNVALEGADDQKKAQVLASLGSFLAEVRQQDLKAHECFVQAHAFSKGSADSKANLAESLLRLKRYGEAREYALAATAAYGEGPVCCSTSFLVVASYLLEGDFEGARKAFVEFESRVRNRGQAALKDLWDYNGLMLIAADKSVEPMTRFVLLTAIDMQTGKLPIGSMSFFDDALAVSATARGASASSK